MHGYIFVQQYLYELQNEIKHGLTFSFTYVVSLHNCDMVSCRVHLKMNFKGLSQCLSLCLHL